jgi:NAD(P)-dependent dehydrogenase (short-subunit alcohol dehydrogenase family)
MGLACAQRLGAGRHVVLGDFCSQRLERATGALLAAGHAVTAVEVDVREPASVASLAETAAKTGELEVAVHTAGISPKQGTSRQIFRVDLYGAALVLDHVLPLMRPTSPAPISWSTAATPSSGAGSTSDQLPVERRGGEGSCPQI